MGRYDRALPRPICRVKNHKAAGTMSNQPDGYDSSRSHASTTVCARTECQEDAREWVRYQTNEDGHFRTFQQNRARAGA